jgi:hypothetical protein
MRLSSSLSRAAGSKCGMAACSSWRREGRMEERGGGWWVMVSGD